MKKLAVLLLIAAAFVGGYGYGRWYGKPVAAAGAPERKILYWVDPMHPWYKSDKPGIAPDCGMKLVPVYAGEEKPIPSSRMPPGTVQITPEKQQLIGVEYGTAEYETVTGSIRAAARVTLDETRIAKVQPRLEGWIDQVFVDFTGKQVEKGDPLLTIYSPEALATQQEYLLALKAQHTDARQPAARNGGQHRQPGGRGAASAWSCGTSPTAQIDEIGRTGKTAREPHARFAHLRLRDGAQRLPQTARHARDGALHAWPTSPPCG